MRSAGRNFHGNYSERLVVPGVLAFAERHSSLVCFLDAPVGGYRGDPRSCKIAYAVGFANPAARMACEALTVRTHSGRVLANRRRYRGATRRRLVQNK